MNHINYLLENIHLARNGAKACFWMEQCEQSKDHLDWMQRMAARKIEVENSNNRILLTPNAACWLFNQAELKGIDVKSTSLHRRFTRCNRDGHAWSEDQQLKRELLRSKVRCPCCNQRMKIEHMMLPDGTKRPVTPFEDGDVGV